MIITLGPDELSTARTLADLVITGNRRRWRTEPRRFHSGFVAQVAFLKYLAEDTIIVAAGPLPYLGPGLGHAGGHQPENFILWHRGRRVSVDIHAPTRFTDAVNLPQKRVDSGNLADYVVLAEVVGDAVRLHGAATRESIQDAARGLTSHPAATKSQRDYYRLPRSLFGIATLRDLLGQADLSPEAPDRSGE